MSCVYISQFSHFNYRIQFSQRQSERKTLFTRFIAFCPLLPANGRIWLTAICNCWIQSNKKTSFSWQIGVLLLGVEIQSFSDGVAGVRFGCVEHLIKLVKCKIDAFLSISIVEFRRATLKMKFKICKKFSRLYNLSSSTAVCSRTSHRLIVQQLPSNKFNLTMFSICISLATSSLVKVASLSLLSFTLT